MITLNSLAMQFVSPWPKGLVWFNLKSDLKVTLEQQNQYMKKHLTRRAFLWYTIS